MVKCFPKPNDAEKNTQMAEVRVKKEAREIQEDADCLLL